MTCANSRAAIAAALATLFVSVTIASANPAEDKFKEGRDLMKAGKYAEACAAFGESQRLDPSLGTQFNIAQCQEKTGKLASALKIYRDLAQYDTNETRKAAASALADKLAPRVSQLNLKVDPAPPAGTVVTLDGVECDSCLKGPTNVDLGKLAIIVKAPGFQAATSSAAVTEESKVVTVTVVLQKAATAPTLPPAGGASTVIAPEPREQPAAPKSRRKLVGVITVAGGGAMIGAGIFVGVLARNRNQDAKDVCGGSNTCANDADTEYANALADSARTRAHISTALFVAGGITAAAGVYLFVTAPKERAVTVSATASPGSIGLVLGGRF